MAEPANRAPAFTYESRIVSGRCTYIVDGDTADFEFKPPFYRVPAIYTFRCRLARINAPELNAQPAAAAAASAYLSQLILNRDVTLILTHYDNNTRIIVEASTPEIPSIGNHMVEVGHAIYDPRYIQDPLL